MLLSEARNIVTQSAFNSGIKGQFSEAETDRAIIAATNFFVQRTTVVTKTNTVALTADTAAKVHGISDLRPEYIILAEVIHPSSGAWTISTAYTEGYVVTNGGKYYLCSVSHTSAADDEPGTGADWQSKWELKATDSAGTLLRVTYDTIVRHLGKDTTSRKPTELSFQTASTLFVYPMPDIPYSIRFIYKEPAATITAGGSGTQTLNIPDAYIYPVLMFGAVHFLQAEDPESSLARDAWAKFQQFIQSVNHDVSFGCEWVRLPTNRV